ncbi:hypothetical protein AnigIFM63326_008441 [Aspergillus niger]|nr:hypothetical protein AnigIFM63326_008441 [Aspergillus niger]
MQDSLRIYNIKNDTMVDDLTSTTGSPSVDYRHHKSSCPASNETVFSTLYDSQTIDDTTLTGKFMPPSAKPAFSESSKLPRLFQKLTPTSSTRQSDCGKVRDQTHIVTLHWAVYSETESHLGFAADNRRTNVTLTRARACLIVVANGTIIDNDRLSDLKPMEVHSEVLVQVQTYQKINLV